MNSLYKDYYSKKEYNEACNLWLKFISPDLTIKTADNTLLECAENSFIQIITKKEFEDLCKKLEKENYFVHFLDNHIFLWDKIKCHCHRRLRFEMPDGKIAIFAN